LLRPTQVESYMQACPFTLENARLAKFTISFRQPRAAAEFALEATSSTATKIMPSPRALSVQLLLKTATATTSSCIQVHGVGIIMPRPSSIAPSPQAAWVEIARTSSRVQKATRVSRVPFAAQAIT